MLATETKKQILIVDRDVATVEPLRQKLSEAGFAVRAIADGGAAASAVAERPPHLVIIDWNTPGFAALELIKGLRLRAGPADHPPHHPFGARRRAGYRRGPRTRRRRLHREAVFAARGGRQGAGVVARAAHRGATCVIVLRRPGAGMRDQPGISAGRAAVVLRGVEYRLLEFFMSHPGRTFNRGQLLAQVWGDDSEVDERTVDVNVQRLRKILTEPGYEAYIQTVRGFGYRFASPSASGHRIRLRRTAHHVTILLFHAMFHG